MQVAFGRWENSFWSGINLNCFLLLLSHFMDYNKRNDEKHFLYPDYGFQDWYLFCGSTSTETIHSNQD